MTRLLFVVIALLGMSAAALGDYVTITLDPATQNYPPGASAFECQLGGGAPPCVMFSGTITDNDTDSSLLFLTGVTLSAYNNYFTVDNTFSTIPGVYEGDLFNLIAPNSYSGVIMGLDIAPGTPAGAYTANAQFAGFGGASDPNDLGFTQNVQLTVVVTPEPSTSGMVFAGLLAAIAARRLRRPRAC